MHTSHQSALKVFPRAALPAAPVVFSAAAPEPPRLDALDELAVTRRRPPDAEIYGNATRPVSAIRL